MTAFKSSFRRPSGLAPLFARMRPSVMALGVVGAALLFMALLLLRTVLTNDKANAEAAGLTRALGLTDLALFTEARYTRHPSQADLHTPFQDHPMSFDHFPSGSLVPPSAPATTSMLFHVPTAGKR